MDRISTDSAQIKALASKPTGPKVVITHAPCGPLVEPFPGWDCIARLRGFSFLACQSKDGSEVHLLHPNTGCWSRA